jgi:hypothetical protein
VLPALRQLRQEVSEVRKEKARGEKEREKGRRRREGGRDGGAASVFLSSPTWACCWHVSFTAALSHFPVPFLPETPGNGQ